MKIKMKHLVIAIFFGHIFQWLIMWPIMAEYYANMFFG